VPENESDLSEQEGSPCSAEGTRFPQRKSNLCIWERLWGGGGRGGKSERKGRHKGLKKMSPTKHGKLGQGASKRKQPTWEEKIDWGTDQEEGDRTRGGQ